jgi:hypothetical protein
MISTCWIIIIIISSISISISISIISASCHHHFSIISSSFQHHFSIISASFHHHFIIISSSFQHHFSIISACIPATFPKSNIIKHSISQTFPSPSQDKKQCVEKFLLPIGPDIRAMRAKEREAYCLLVGFWGKHQAWRPGRLGDLFLEISREFESHPTRPGWPQNLETQAMTSKRLTFPTRFFEEQTFPQRLPEKSMNFVCPLMP